ncbi:MAG: hypothetical protein ACI9J3_001017 [Parvicellaceae bacterium]|jgi:hypothetical protein
MNQLNLKSNFAYRPLNKLVLFIAVPLALVTVSCGSEEHQALSNTDIEEVKSSPAFSSVAELVPEDIIATNDIAEEISSVKSRKKKRKKRKNKSHQVAPIAIKLKDSISDRSVYHISESTIDSLNQIYEVYDENNFGNLAVSYFGDMASGLNGKAFYAEGAEDIMLNIMEILSTRLNDGTDLVLLIDKTGSMEDDLETVKRGLTMIETHLKKYPNVNIAVASYGDINWHGELWFNSSEMDNDISKISKFMDGYTIMPNPDTPESVNEGIMKVVDNTDWTPGNKRMILVIGDAPSQKPPFSRYTSDQVVAHCDSMGVKFNLYPIIIGGDATFHETGIVQAVAPTAFPNPVVDKVTLKFGQVDSYNVHIYDLNGKEVKMQTVYAAGQIEFDLSDLKNGVYFAQVYTMALTRNGVVKLIVNH